MIGAVGIYVDVDNSGTVNGGDINVTAEASDGIFDTDVSEGTYVAQNGVGLIVNEVVSTDSIDYRADNLVTVNASLTATTDSVQIVSRTSDVVLLDATLNSDNDDVVVKARQSIVGDTGTLSVTAADDIEFKAAQGGVDVSGGTMTVGDVLKITAEDTLRASNAVLRAAGSGNLMLRSVSGDVEVNRTNISSPAGVIDIQAGNDVLGDRVFASNGGVADIKVKAGRDINIPSTGVFITRSTFGTLGDLRMTAGRDIIGPEAVLDGSVSADSDVLLKAVGSVIIPEITMGAGDRLEIRATNGDVDITASQNIRSSGDIVVEAGTDIHADLVLLTAGPDADDTASFKAGRDINMAGQSAMAFGATSAGGDLRLTAGRDINGENQFFTSFLGAVHLRANGAVRVTNSEITAGGTGDIKLQAVNNDVEVNRTNIFSPAGVIDIQAGNDVLGDRVFAQNGGVADIKVRAGRDINIPSTGDFITRTTFAADGDLRMTAGRDIIGPEAVLQSSLTADSVVLLKAVGSVIIPEITIGTGGKLEIRATNGDVDLTTSQNIRSFGDIVVEAGTDIHADLVLLTAGPDADDTASFKAGRDINMAGASPVSFGLTSAGGDLRLTAGRDINGENQFFASGLGGVHLRANGAVRVTNSEITAGATGDVRLQAVTGNIEADDASLEAGNNIVLDAAVNVLVDNTLLKFGGFLVISGTQIGTPIIV